MSTLNLPLHILMYMLHGAQMFGNVSFLLPILTGIARTSLKVLKILVCIFHIHLRLKMLLLTVRIWKCHNFGRFIQSLCRIWRRQHKQPWKIRLHLRIVWPLCMEWMPKCLIDIWWENTLCATRTHSYPFSIICSSRNVTNFLRIVLLV